MATQEVTLNPGESKVVSFEVIPNEAKTYEVSVNGLTGSFRAMPTGPVDLVVGDVTIHNMNGITFTSVGTELYKDIYIPYAVLAEPLVTSKMKAIITLNFTYTGRAYTFNGDLTEYKYSERDRLEFVQYYEPGAGVQHIQFKAPLTGNKWRVPFSGTVKITSLIGHGSYSPQPYNVRCFWGPAFGENSPEKKYFFRLKNAVRCTGSGSF